MQLPKHSLVRCILRCRAAWRPGSAAFCALISLTKGCHRSSAVDTVIACSGAVGSDLGDVKPVSDVGESKGDYQTTSPAKLDLGLRLTQCGNRLAFQRVTGCLTVWIATRAKHTARRRTNRVSKNGRGEGMRMSNGGCCDQAPQSFRRTTSPERCPPSPKCHHQRR